MQTFNRTLTREIEIEGQRVVVTLDKEGIRFRLVGSRQKPREISWAACLDAAVRMGISEPAPEEALRALEILRCGALAQPGSPGLAPGKEAEGELEMKDRATEADPSLRELLQRLELWLSAHRPRFLRALLPGADREEIEALRQAFPCPVPDELRTLLCWHNGQSPEIFGALEESWILMSTGDIMDVKSQLDEEKPDGWQVAWIPFLDNDAGSYLCLDTDQPGCPVRACWEGRQAHPVVAPSLTAWMKEFVTAVEKEMYYEDPERGGFHRRSK